jgi:hypothetical protein
MVDCGTPGSPALVQATGEAPLSSRPPFSFLVVAGTSHVELSGECEAYGPFASPASERGQLEHRVPVSRRATNVNL